MEFNLTRFWNHICREMVMYKKTYINYVIAPIIIGFVAEFFARNAQVVSVGLTTFMCIFIVIYILCGVTIAAFGGYKTTRKSISSILVPSSTEEKWLTEFLEHYIVLPAIAIITSIAGVALGELVFNQTLIQTPNFRHIIFEQFSFQKLLPIYAMISVSFFGSLFYKKLSIFKTAATLFVFFMIYAGLAAFFAIDSIREITNVNQPDPMAILEYGFAMENYTQPFEIVMYAITILFFTALSYVRLKKEEQA